MELLGYLIIGGLAGWAAGKVLVGSGFGIFGNVLIGVVGGVLGGLLFRLLGLFAESGIGSFVTAFVGAVALLFLLRFFNKKA